MLSCNIREKKKDMFISTFICTEKLSKKSLDNNKINDLSGKKGVGIRWMGDKTGRKVKLFTSDF